VVGLIIFVVLNFLLVTPLFGQLGQAENQLSASENKLKKYEGEIARASTYERIEDRLKKEGGDVLSEELQLQRIIDNQARVSGVQVSRYNPTSRTQMGRTNQFFEDQALTIDFTTGGKELVEFLVGLASGNSMIHVQDMTLRPVQGGTRLGGNIVFVASYQKTPAARSVESGAAPKTTAKATPTTKTNAPPAKANPTTAKTNAHPATKTNVINRLKDLGPPPKKGATIATPAAANGSRKISTNAPKPLK
jgi:hypothetical protein